MNCPQAYVVMPWLIYVIIKLTHKVMSRMNRKTIKEIERLLNETSETSADIITYCETDTRKGVQLLLNRWKKQREQEAADKAKYHEMSLYENELQAKGYKYIAGIDEAGRGPLAGPVVAAAVILPPSFYLPGLNDSKQLSEQKRDQYYDEIIQSALAVGVGIISAQEIDTLNIYQAAKAAMKKAVQALNVPADYLLVDAMEIPVETPQQSLIKGDAKSVSIAASSIVAKVTRDRFMRKLGEKYPKYGFEKHMGYGTAHHIQAIEEFGVMEEHRRSFAPIRDAISGRKG